MIPTEPDVPTLWCRTQPPRLCATFWQATADREASSARRATRVVDDAQERAGCGRSTEALTEARWLRALKQREGDTPGRISKDYSVNPVCSGDGGG